MIDRAQWEKIQSVFGQVMDSSPAERAAALAASCAMIRRCENPWRHCSPRTKRLRIRWS